MFAVVPPAIQGLGVSGGFQMMLQLKGAGFDFAKIGQMTDEMVRDGNTQSGLHRPEHLVPPGLPADRRRRSTGSRPRTLNVPVGSVFSTLQSYLGSDYVNQFNKFGRDLPGLRPGRQPVPARARRHPPALRAQHRRPDGPARDPDRRELQDRAGRRITLYNLYPAAPINGMAAPGYSSGQALKIMEDMAAQKLPADMGFEWTACPSRRSWSATRRSIVFAHRLPHGLPGARRPVRELDRRRRR